MGSLVVINWISLDGVMQAPGRPGEDPRGGFAHEGWATAFSDDVAGAKMGEQMGGRHAFLFGRLTYEILLSSWNEQGGPFKDALNSTPKYVVSRAPDTELAWPESTLVTGMEEIAQLKSGDDRALVVMGSGELIADLIGADLIDRYLLLLAPVVLGEGRRMFAGDGHTALRLVDSTPTSTGAVVLTYVPANRL